MDAYQQTFGPIATADLRDAPGGGAARRRALLDRGPRCGVAALPADRRLPWARPRAAGQQWAGSQWRDAVGAERQHFERAVVEAARGGRSSEAEARAAEAARAQALLSDGLGSSGRMGFLGRGAR